MNIRTISTILIVGVISTVLAYSVIIVTLTWPISEFSVNKAGVFGDSFGILTSLFSGLAFSGMIITILLQREELQLQRQELRDNRKEFAKSADAQERSAQLSALTVLHSENESQISKKEASKSAMPSFLGIDGKRRQAQLNSELEELFKRKVIILEKIEEILRRSGVELQ